MQKEIIVIVVSGANSDLSKQDIDNNLEAIRDCDIVILQLEVPLETVCYAAKIAKEMGKMVILDPAPVPKEFPEELYQYLDIIKPNETELGMLTGIKEPESQLKEAVQCLREKGVHNIIVTLGEKGVYVDCKTMKAEWIPAIKVHAVDTTAAGDSFTAALAIMLAEGKSLRSSYICKLCFVYCGDTKRGTDFYSYLGRGEVLYQIKGNCTIVFKK